MEEFGLEKSLTTVRVLNVHSGESFRQYAESGGRFIWFQRGTRIL